MVNCSQEVYESASLDSIDLMVGGVAEANVRGGAVGPTFACIIGSLPKSPRKLF
jgi:hypothetical protein